MSTDKLQKIELTTGYTSKVEAGFHTFQFKRPLEIKSNDFAVVVEINSTSEKSLILGETNKIPNVSTSLFDFVEISNSKCFLATESDFEQNNWVDLTTINSLNSEIPNLDTSIKVYTKNNITNNNEEEEETEVGGETSNSQDKNTTNTKVDLSNLKAEIQDIKVRIYSDENKENYLMLKMSISNLKNIKDGVEYYYYLSQDPNKTIKSIKDATKITNKTDNADGFEFYINSTDLANPKELSEATNLYLYIIAVESGDESELISSGGIVLEAPTNYEIYINDVLISNDNLGYSLKTKETTKEENGVDTTVATKSIPKTGIQPAITIISIVGLIALISFIKFKIINIK